MDKVFLHILNASINASWIVLAVAVLRLLLKKAPKWVTSLMWGIVALRLIIPVSFQSPISLIPRAETVPVSLIESDNQQEVPDTGIVALDKVLNSHISEEYVIKENVIYTRQEYEEVIKAEETVKTEDTSSVDNVTKVNGLVLVTRIAAIIWVVGVSVMLMYWSISYVRLARRMKTATPLKCTEYEKLRIKQSEHVASPFILGIIRPTVYLPYSVEEAHIKCVLAHENAHIKRKDYIVKPIAFALLSVHWFNPFMWVSYLLLCRDIEYACDEKVVNDMPKEERQRYSKAILENSVSKRAIAACPVAFGEIGVKERVKSVINYKKPTFWMIVTALVACTVVAVCFLTNPINKANAENGTSPSGETVVQDENATQNGTVAQTESTTVSEKYYDIVVEKEIANQIAIEFNLPNGCTFKQGNAEEYLIMPYAYDKTDRSWPAGSRMSTGSIEIITDTSRFTFSEDGKLTGGIPLSNHASYSKLESLSGLVWPAMIAYWDYDLYTLTEEYELKEQGKEVAYTTSQYWTIYFVSPNHNTAFSVSLAANKFTKEQAIAVAKTVKIVEYNSNITAGKTRVNYQNMRYNATFDHFNYVSYGSTMTDAIKFSTYCGRLKNITSTTMTKKELEDMGIKEGAKVYTKSDTYGNSFYIRLSENEDLSIGFSR